MKHHSVIVLAIIVVALAIALLVFSKPSSLAYVEAGTIAKDVRSFQELSDRFTDLAEEKGAVYAYEILKRASLPPNTDLHLLGHVVGDELYKQKSVEGIADCTQDFRNACSHSIVIGTLGEFGNGALDAIREACKKAPGGSGAYTMCFHGLGHGVLAFNEYDFARTQEFCEKTGTEEYNNREYAECMGGAVMEIISGGGHDQKTWGEKRGTYLFREEPLSLCQDDFFDERTRAMCYTYITPFLFEAAGGNLGRPLPQDFERGFRFCAELPEGSIRDMCFGGFGKEFLVLAQDRDVRRIEDMTQDQMLTVHSWCELAHDEVGTNECILSAMQSAYWGGENKPDAAILLCSVANEEYRERCFESLAEEVGTYVEDVEYRKNFCSIIAPEYQDTCEGTLL
ncbi:hypothetical protein COU18_02435 [Candidatus Kaiserbacteria bacterium CG10_big_fil_rev_8_21_14_0_10_51_14]|uniref:Uncharacterized protein n=1 Tax=Candidatus Kaiserbacteria bacterium CG10_big_fil_rev_8_21_14_0_10_51_14 TaxID=1974610 RepID=A0A2H0UBU9_9BACT|nr:MAG: hypothetical protein COU18_02435 [Candidatus Kaiserbacteria bacterium CG10_big_fil_rev_8_21_14_0_10_51_14]